MRFNLIVSSQAVARFTMMSLGGWIRLLEAFKEPAAVFKVKFLTGQKLEKTYSLTRFCLLLTGWHQIRIFTTGKPFWLKLLTFKPPRFGFLLFTQFRQCFTHTFNLLWHSTLSQNPVQSPLTSLKPFGLYIPSSSHLLGNICVISCW